MYGSDDLIWYVEYSKCYHQNVPSFDFHYQENKKFYALFFVQRSDAHYFKGDALKINLIKMKGNRT